MPLELFTSVVNVNLVASFLCTREAFKIFKSQTPTGGAYSTRRRTPHGSFYDSNMVLHGRCYFASALNPFYSGRIINNGSLAAHVPRPHSAAYACSKHAVSGLTKSSAIEGRSFDISVTQIDIGASSRRGLAFLSDCL